jgi:ABC-2 type transport system permease protein
MSSDTTTPRAAAGDAGGGLGLIVRRELGVYARSRGGYVIAALVLAITGLLFNVDAVGSGSKYSADVLADFFKDASGVMMVAGILVSMRLIAEERQSGTLPLLLNSSLTEGQVVVAKFLSAWIFLCVLIGLSLYMPALIFLRGKVSVAHIGVGYLGLFLLGGATVAIGTFGSAIARTQVVAAIVGASLVVLMLVVWLLARIVDGPLGEVFGYLALWDKHFTPFMRGTLALPGVVYYLSVIALFLTLARNSLESRRWST